MKEVKKTRIASFDRVRQMPDVFDLREVQDACGVSREVAHLYCHRWVSRKYVEPFGPRVGVYFNILKNPNSKSLIGEAIDLALRPAAKVVVGVTALREHGATTQKSDTLQIAIPVHRTTRTLPQLNGVDLIPRAPEWFVTVAGHHSPGKHGLPVLDPAYALVDALTTKVRSSFPDDIWRPDPDDIEVPDGMTPDEFRDAILEAADALGADRSFIEDYVSRVGDKLGNGM